MPDSVFVEAARRYITIYETLSGRTFEAEVGDRGRGLHQRPDRRVRGVGDGGERGLDRREHAPHVRHDRAERHRPRVGPAVQRRQAVGRYVMDPADELVEVPAQSLCGQERDPDDRPTEEDRREDEPVTPRPPLRARRVHLRWPPRQTRLVRQ
ncbi:MAG: hypothetical protein ACTS8Z_00495 [Candidatus Limnocylindrales bacterium]